MTSFPSRISAIIFDLGGVLIDLSVPKTVQAFASLSGLPEENVMETYLKHADFLAYERGEISDDEFRSMLRRIFSLKATDSELERCWNAMLLALPEKRLELIKTVKNKFSVYVLSNTNSIHIRYVNDVFLNGQPLDSHFHKCYYSHTVGMRKPESRIFEHVLQDAGLVANETAFLDDNLENLSAAMALGIHTVHITHPDQIFDVLEV